MSKNKILENSGWWILSILSLLPVLLWLLELPVGLRLSSLSAFSKSLGDVAGLCGMAMFSLVMILSARLKFFEKFFKGINKSYTAHHFFGGLALVLLLFHPIFLAYNYVLVSFKSGAMFLLPSGYWPQDFGIYGLFVMIITLVITFYTKLKYQIWKFTHKFLGLAFIFAFFHVFFIGADVANNQWLKIYLLVLALCAIATYFYRTLFADYLVRSFTYVVKDIKKHEDKIWEIEFYPKNRIIKFIPGQFAFVKLFSKNLSKESHPFSFSSAVGNPLKIAIKELGDYTNKIGNIKAGDLAEIEGPFGVFNFESHNNKKQVWIAGGVGITPFLSMLRALNNTDYNITLYYSVKDESGLAFRSEIKEIAIKNPNLKIIFWISSKDGFINANSIKEQTPDLSQRDILICGPTEMMAILKKQFLSLGLAEKQMHTEEFQLY